MGRGAACPNRDSGTGPPQGIGAGVAMSWQHVPISARRPLGVSWLRASALLVALLLLDLLGWGTVTQLDWHGVGAAR